MTIAQDEPGFADPFPAAEHNDTSVLATCDGYLLKFEPASDPAKAALSARFILKELPATFVADLRADRDLYGPADDAQETRRREKVQDTTAIELALSEASKQIRYLNAIMNDNYSRDAEKLRGWKSAIHVERDPKRKKKDGGGSSVGA